MASEAGIAKALLQLALGLGSAIRANPMSFPSMVRAGAFAHGNPGMSAGADAFTAKNYPSDFAPDSYHTYNVEYQPSQNGKANENIVGRDYMSLIKDAGRMQTLEEHNAALTQFIHPNMTPKQLQLAIDKGRQAEKELKQFWNESDSKVNPHRAQFAVSSSAVSGIRLTPDGRVQVKWKNKKGDSPWYTYRQYPDVQLASVAAQELLSSPSIGRAVMPFQRNGQMLKFKDPSLYSAWSVKNYDTGFA